MESYLTLHERKILAKAEPALGMAIELRDWWRDREADEKYPNRYQQSISRSDSDQSFGFYGQASLASGPLLVNGNIQQMFFDAPKAPESNRDVASDWIRQQICEFVFKYFMRISDFRRIQKFAEPRSSKSGKSFSALSQCPDSTTSIGGFGFKQLFFKREGLIGRFPTSEDQTIVDMRDLKSDFEWIVLTNPIYDFKLSTSPFGSKGLRLEYPLSSINYLITSPEFVVHEENPEPGVVARYGIGYAFLKNPDIGIFAYGPGALEPAFEQLIWYVMEDGSIHARFIFVAKQPEGILNVSLNPFAWMPGCTPSRSLLDRFQPFSLRFDPVFPFVDFLNLITFGQAANQLCISRTDILKSLMFVHFLQHHEMALASIRTWRQIPDWLATESLPASVITGRV